MANGFVWFDVNAEMAAIPAMINFYRAVFDGPITMGEPGSAYQGWLMNADRPWAGVVAADDLTTGHWVPYVQVDDLDAAVQAAVAAGGTVVVPRTAGPAGEAVTMTDPAGALIALWIPFATGH